MTWRPTASSSQLLNTGKRLTYKHKFECVGVFSMQTFLRDGSACASYYVEPGETLTRWIPHKRISNAEDEYEIRNSQVHHRSGEVSRALDLLCEIKAGNFPAVVNSWDPEVKDENGAGVFTFSDLKAAMNIEKPVIMGKLIVSSFSTACWK